MDAGLTDLQRRVHAAVLAVAADGWPVAVREIAARAGIASLETAHRTLRELEAVGLLETNPRWPSRRGGWRPVNASVNGPAND